MLGATSTCSRARRLTRCAQPDRGLAVRRTERAEQPGGASISSPDGDGSGAQPPGDFIIGSSSRRAGVRGLVTTERVPVAVCLS